MSAETRPHPLDLEPELVTTMLVSFLREETASAGMSRAVLGLSGGIDSAVVAALCARAFGPENVLAVLLPYRTSNPDSRAHAELVARALALPTRLVDLSAMADGYLTQERITDPRRRGNVLARCRMTILFDLSVEWRGLVIGTSNKSEILLGYSTWFGDSAHALNPLGDLYKHQVYQLARHLSLPREVVAKAPSADLAPDQTDESELGFTYAEADLLLHRLVDQRATPAELLAEGCDPTLLAKLRQRVASSHYKRLPPPIAKLHRRTIGPDFRYLRDWNA
jgi:NAD+ synthase